MKILGSRRWAAIVTLTQLSSGCFPLNQAPENKSGSESLKIDSYKTSLIFFNFLIKLTQCSREFVRVYHKLIYKLVKLELQFTMKFPSIFLLSTNNKYDLESF